MAQSARISRERVLALAASKLPPELVADPDFYAPAWLLLEQTCKVPDPRMAALAEVDAQRAAKLATIFGAYAAAIGTELDGLGPARVDGN